MIAGFNWNKIDCLICNSTKVKIYKKAFHNNGALIFHTIQLANHPDLQKM